MRTRITSSTPWLRALPAPWRERIEASPTLRRLVPNAGWLVVDKLARMAVSNGPYAMDIPSGLAVAAGVAMYSSSLPLAYMFFTMF